MFERWLQTRLEHQQASFVVDNGGCCVPSPTRLKLVNATLDELSARSDDPDEEMSRMDRLGRQYQLDYLQATARHRHSSLLRPHNSETGSVPGAEGEALGAEGGDGTPSPVLSVAAASAAAAAAAAAAGGDELPVTGNAWGSCDVCR